MGAAFTISRRHGYVEMDLRGEVDFEVAKRMWESVLKECVDSGQKKILGICERSNSWSLQNELEFVNYFTGLDRIREYRIAWIEITSANYEEIRFTETLLRNRGIVSRTFQNIHDAEAWLLE
ncbi:hypothetical protein [Desulfocurvus sp. DL9XJH121]